MEVSQLVCPNCGRDQVQKVSAIVAGSVVKGKAKGEVNARTISMDIDGQTELGRSLSAPTGELSRGCMEAMGILFVVGGFLMLIWLIGNVTQPDSWFRDFSGDICGVFWILVVFGVVLLVCGVLMLRASEKAPNQSEVNTRYQNALSKWNQLFYCHICDGVFIPGQGLLVPREKMRDFLYDEWPDKIAKH